MKTPDPVLHLRISLVKSALRIAAGLVLLVGLVAAAGILIILAEILGIAEELF
jgi:hypothetical protein